MERVLAIPDCHYPFHNQDSLSLVYALIEKLHPTVVIQLGDLYDMYSFSKYPRSQDIMTPAEEIAEGRLAAEAMWRNVIKSASKTTRMIQLFGNHDVRPKKRIEEKYPEIASLIDLNHLWQFHNVETINEDRAKFEIDGVIYTHGFRSKLGDHMKFLGKSVVRGHSHRAGVVWLNQWDKLLFEMECGFIADDKAEPLKYTHTQQMQWIQACGFISDYGPQIVPLR
jgi:predicted MPP superfamily phosphohydrolase